jgi:hypothetical protein
LLAGLAGPCGNGEVFAWAGLGDAGAVPGSLFGWIGGAGLFQDWPAGVGIEAPRDAADLMTRLHETDEATAAGTLTGLVPVSLAYRTRGRLPRGHSTPPGRPGM